MGDLVYSIPSIKSIQRQTGEPFGKANLYLRPDQPGGISPAAGTRPPVRMSRAEAESLLPLLRGQRGFAEVALYDGQAIDCDLDRFRDQNFNLAAYDITRYYSLAFKVRPANWKPWLRVEPAKEYAGAILVNRTTRYRNPKISYRFLSGKPNVYFVGYQQEYAEFVKDCPRIPHLVAPDALTLAQWIAGAKLLVGNQSFLFSIAEALKTPRVLELYPQAPNVIIHGPNGADAVSQDIFEGHVTDYINKDI